MRESAAIKTIDRRHWLDVAGDRQARHFTELIAKDATADKSPSMFIDNKK